MSKNIWDSISAGISETNESADTSAFTQHIEKLKNQKLNILFVGATGVGKSSTINALFNTAVSDVGYGVNPETVAIQKYEMDNLILWDSPGLGDSPEKDKIYATQIASTLKERDSNGQVLIDGVVVIIDGSNRDMKTAYEVIEQIISPYIGESSRLTIAINQCDMALKGRYWDHDQCKPEPQLVAFLKDKVDSVKNRIFESTGVIADPIYYSALHNYNISKLLSVLIKTMPVTKRFLLTDSLNKNPDIWRANDNLANYNQEIQVEIKGSLTKALDAAAKGAAAGATVGALIPVVGPVIGAAVGAALGFLGGLIE